MVGSWSPREKHATIHFDHENLPKSWQKVIAILVGSPRRPAVTVLPRSVEKERCARNLWLLGGRGRNQ